MRRVLRGRWGSSLLAATAIPARSTGTAAASARPTSELTVAAIRERFDGETRVAVVPDHVAALLKAGGFKRFLVEAGAGAAANFSDADYTKAGATIVNNAGSALGDADVLLHLRPLSPAEARQLKAGALVVSYMYEAANAEAAKALGERSATVLAMERVPRTLSRAQSFDATTSQLGIVGYRAVLEGAHAFGRPLAGKMTMAGRIPPAKVLVVGAAVAGLEAIATAKNLGAAVYATDTRPDAKEQIVAAGGRALEPDGVKGEAGSGGYAKVMGPEYMAAAERMYAKAMKDTDIVITTALIPGRPAPKVITAEHVAAMRPGSVIVDCAAEQGGNVVGTVPGKTVRTANGVTIVGITNLAGCMPQQSSRLYSATVSQLLQHAVDSSTPPPAPAPKGADGKPGKAPPVVHMLGVSAAPEADEVVRCTTAIEKGAVLPLQMAAAPPAPPSKAAVAKVEEAPTPLSWYTWTWVGAVGVMLAIGFGAPASFVFPLSLFTLACMVGYYVVWGVTHALHSPLMSVTNAISGLVIVGGMLLSGPTFFPSTLSASLAATAVGLAAVNIAGGFLITYRMLALFRRKGDPEDPTPAFMAPAAAGAVGILLAAACGVPHAHAIGYLMSSAFCVASLAALSTQSTARFGVPLGASGVLWGIVSAGASLAVAHLPVAAFLGMAVCMGVGASAGVAVGRSTSPMNLPQLVAAFHSLVGLAAILVCLASHFAPAAAAAAAAHGGMAGIHHASVYWGSVIGGVTFTGSIVAFLKLDGRLRSGALAYAQRDQVNMAMGAVTLACYGWYALTAATAPLMVASAVSLVAGWHLVDAVGGADMPVCITVLNSYSGWALVAEGFLLDNALLTTVGCLIGASGAILTYIMCVAMNRSIWNVLFGSYADLGAAAATGPQGVHRETSSADVVQMLANAKNVIIVPGFGLCQARAQYAVAEAAAALIAGGVSVKFGIHPVAGRMPGQLNVLLAEAGVPYDQVHEMHEVNPEFPEADVALIIGANDVVNPAAVEDPKSALAGMPVLQVWKAKTSVVLKRSMAVGYAGVENPLFFKPNNYMLFGDAKKRCEELRDGIKAALGSSDDAKANH